MIRTIITPKAADLRLAIPEMYIGKSVEVTLFALDELEPPKKEKKLSAIFLEQYQRAATKN